MHPISEILFKLYANLQENNLVFFPLNQVQKDAIDSVVKTVNGEYGGMLFYPTTEKKAAAYFCHVIKRHPVTDGNKRLAVMFLDIYCSVFNVKINLPEGLGMDQIAVAVEKFPSENMEELIKFVELILFPKQERKIDY